MSWVDWFFPRQCLSCGLLGDYICANCLNKLTVVKKPICPECLKPSLGGMTHPKCRRTLGMDGLVSALEYKGLTERLVKTYKYKYVSALTNDLVELITSFSDWEVLAKKSWLVTAVPLHLKRLRWRGFNQAEKLAQGIADYTGWEINHKLLIRKKYTQTQMSLGRQERLTNLAGAFGAGNEIKEGKGGEVLLVDDVWTTGATMRAGAAVLKKNGVKSVWGLTLARAV